MTWMLTLINADPVAATTQPRSAYEGTPDQEAPVLLHDVSVSVSLDRTVSELQIHMQRLVACVL